MENGANDSQNKANHNDAGAENQWVSAFAMWNVLSGWSATLAGKQDENAVKDINPAENHDGCADYSKTATCILEK